MITLGWESPTFQFKPARRGTGVDTTIPELVFRHRPGELRYWKDCRNVWRAGGKTDYSSWRKYRRLVESRRYHLAYRRGRDPYGFAEGLTALALQRHGFKCWTGVHLFGRKPAGAVMRKKNTQEVEELLKRGGFVLPRDITRGAKNPDIVAYHTRRKEWRFCEVKRTERVQPGQVIGLAVLHLLTGAPVAIVRLLSDGRATPTKHHARFRSRRPIRLV